MAHTPKIFEPRTIAAVEALTLTGFVLSIALPDPARAAGVALMIIGSLGVVVCAGALLRKTRNRRAPSVMAAMSAVGLIGAIAYLHSLADEPAAIPLAGVGVLFLSLVAMTITSVVLAAPNAEGAPSR